MIAGSDKIIGGVCVWISRTFKVQVQMVRIIFIAAAVLGMGAPGVLYLVMWIILYLTGNISGPYDQ